MGHVLPLSYPVSLCLVILLLYILYCFIFYDYYKLITPILFLFWGSKPVKVIYINSPLPQKKMTVRERNQIFHEVPLKFMMSKNTSVPVSAVFMDKPEEYISEMDVCNTLFFFLKRMYLFILLKCNVLLHVSKSGS